MQTLNISTTEAEGSDHTLETPYELGSDIEEEIKRLGPEGKEIIWTRYQRALVVEIQNKVRTKMTGTKTQPKVKDADIVTFVKTYKPVKVKVGVPATDKLLALFGKMSAAEKNAFLAAAKDVKTAAK